MVQKHTAAEWQQIAETNRDRKREIEIQLRDRQGEQDQLVFQAHYGKKPDVDALKAFEKQTEELQAELKTLDALISGAQRYFIAAQMVENIPVKQAVHAELLRVCDQYVERAKALDAAAEAYAQALMLYKESRDEMVKAPNGPDFESCGVYKPDMSVIFRRDEAHWGFKHALQKSGIDVKKFFEGLPGSPQPTHEYCVGALDSMRKTIEKIGRQIQLEQDRARELGL